MSIVNERTAVGAVLLAAPLALLLVARAGEFTALAAFSPLFFPRAVLWCWAVVAALSLALDVRAARRERRAAPVAQTAPAVPAASGPPAVSTAPAASAVEAAPAAAEAASSSGMERGTALRIVAVVAAMAAYVALVTELGFLLSSIGFAVATLLALGIRSPLLVIGYGAAMPTAVFVLFNHALGLPLPTSPFSHLF